MVNFVTLVAGNNAEKKITVQVNRKSWTSWTFVHDPDTTDTVLPRFVDVSVDDNSTYKFIARLISCPEQFSPTYSQSVVVVV